MVAVYKVSKPPLAKKPIMAIEYVFSLEGIGHIWLKSTSSLKEYGHTASWAITSLALVGVCGSPTGSMAHFMSTDRAVEPHPTLDSHLIIYSPLISRQYCTIRCHKWNNLWYHFSSFRVSQLPGFLILYV